MSITFEPKNTRFSIKNAYALALCSHLAYEDAKSINDKMALHGFQTIFLERRETQAYIAFRDDAIVIAFRGTTNIRDWMTDSDMVLTTVRHGMGKVHGGFLRALCLIWEDILSVLKAVQNNQQPIWITGHSLGAALAGLAAARFSLELDKPIAGLYTFGKPRIGDREFARLFNSELKDRCFRFVNNNDIVTRVPPREMNYSHIGSLRFIDSEGKIHEDTSWWSEFLESIRGTLNQQLDLIPSNIENHSMNKYITFIENNL